MQVVLSLVGDRLQPQLHPRSLPLCPAHVTIISLWRSSTVGKIGQSLLCLGKDSNILSLGHLCRSTLTSLSQYQPGTV